MILPALSRPRSEIAISVPASGKPLGTKTSASIPLLAGSDAERRRHRDRLAAGEQAVLAVIEAEDLMDALEPDIERAAVLRDRFRVVPAARGERPPVGTEDRRHLGVGNGARPRAFVDDAAAQPPALVVQGDEMGAVRRDANGRYAAEMLEGRAAARDRRGIRAGRIAGARDREYRSAAIGCARTSIATGGSRRRRLRMPVIAATEQQPRDQRAARRRCAAFGVACLRKPDALFRKMPSGRRSVTRRACACAAARPRPARRTARRASRSWRRRAPRHRRW